MGMVIVNPGIYTTVQDEGRFGYEQFGVSPAGPMDRRSFHIANLLVGNDMGEAELEMTIMGAEIRFTGPAVIALTGADMSPLLNEAPVCMYRAFPVGAGDVLRMQSVSGGCRTYLAAAGGLDNQEQTEVVTILEKSEYAKLLAFIHETDQSAFVTVSTVSEVIGEWNKHKKNRLRKAE